MAYGIRSDAARSGEAKSDSPDATGRLRKRDAGFNVYREESPTLDATGTHAVHYQTLMQNNGDGGNRQVLGIDEPHPTLNLRSPNAVATFGVRRLTPRECEALQGFPRDWTAIPGMADGPRYKCLGNAVTVNVAEWIAARIRAAQKAREGGKCK